MSNGVSSILSTILVPKVTELIAEKQGMSELEAIEAFFNSRTYEALSDEETALWHLSPLALYTIWLSEKETGVPEFPREQ